jgi:hypothetical protein
MAKRPPQLPKRLAPSEVQIERAQYVGSPEHKDQRWWGGLPKGFVGIDGIATRPNKEDTTICRLYAIKDRDKATKWVQSALKAGQYKFYEGDKDYPKKVWFRDEGGQVWFGLCVNSILGQYKGWPIDEEERREVFG